MALRCQCGYEIGIQPHGGADIEIIRMNMDERKWFDDAKPKHENTCKQFKEWEIFFYHV